MNYEKIKNSREEYDKNDKFLYLDNFLKVVTRLSFLNKNIFEYSLYTHFDNYLRYIAIKIYYKNYQSIKSGKSDKEIFESFYLFANNLKMVEEYSLDDREIELKQIYKLDEEEQEKVLNKFEISEIKNRDVKRVFKSYRYITRCEKNKSKFKTPIAKYVYYLIKYTKQLENINIERKVKSNFDGEFYTFLGEIAFKLFNEKNYLTLLKGKDIKRILDIGCGSGCYLDAILKEYKDIQIFGVERQQEVYKKLQAKYGVYDYVHIINDDIENVSFDQKFDVINLVYMLFYLNPDQQKKLFLSLYDLLYDSGEIIVGQYFPNIEKIQMLLAKEDNKWSVLDQYTFKVSNNILYGEVLLNEAFSEFSYALRLDSFEKMLSEIGFYIKEVNKADSSYYSFYLVIGKVKVKKTGGM